MSGERRFRIWRGGLSGAYYAGWSVSLSNDLWRAAGPSHDVTADIEEIIRLAASAVSGEPTDEPGDGL